MGGCCKRALNLNNISDSITTEPDEEIQDKESKKLELMIFDEQFNRDYSLVYNEIICQICNNRLNKPMTLPCLTHSICLTCVDDLWKGWLKAGAFLICPTCGESGGTRNIQNEDFLKLNSELDNIIQAYDKEREKWFSDKKRLEDLLCSYQNDKIIVREISIDELTIRLSKLNKKSLVGFCTEFIKHFSKGDIVNPLELLNQIHTSNSVDSVEEKESSSKNGNYSIYHIIILSLFLFVDAMINDQLI